LADNVGWACSLVALPDTPDPQLAAWLEQVCDLPVARATREWAMIFPQPYALDDDGSLKIDTDAKLLFAIRSAGQTADAENEIVCASGQQRRSAVLAGAGTHCIEIAIDDRASSQPVHLSWDGSTLASLAAVPFPEAEAEPAVVLSFGEGAEASAFSMHRTRCRAMLEQVRLGTSHITDLRVPFDLRGQLRWRTPGEDDWQRETLAHPDVSARVSGLTASLGPEQVHRVDAVLQDRSSEAELDFGAFGRFSAPAVLEEAVRRVVQHLRRDLRERVEWLCKASGALVNVDRRPLALLDDVALLRHFSDLDVPPALLAHRRALLRLLGLAGVPSP
jgi:hypothetical protein